MLSSSQILWFQTRCFWQIRDSLFYIKWLPVVYDATICLELLKKEARDKKGKWKGLIDLILLYSYLQSLILIFPVACMKLKVWNRLFFSQTASKKISKTIFCHRLISKTLGFGWLLDSYLFSLSKKKKSGHRCWNILITWRQCLRHCCFQHTREWK